VALEQVQADLKQRGVKLDDGELQNYRIRNVTHGWKLSVTFDRGLRELLFVLLDRDFPFSRPLIAVDPARFLQWPHVESDGILCALPDSSTFDSFAPVALIDYLLGEAAILVEACQRGELDEDFRNEFYSYWNRTIPDEQPEIVSVISSFDRSRVVALWRGKPFYLLADDEAQASDWLRKRFSCLSKALSFDSAGLVMIPKPLLPSEYPKNGSHVYRYLQADPHAKFFLNPLIKSEPERLLIILAATTVRGPALAPVQVSAPRHMNILGRKTATMERGFRRGHIPESLQLSRFFVSEAKSQRMAFERADAGWIHGRGQMSQVATLQSRRVVIFGIGSLGGFVAEKLASAGIGHLELVDPEVLTFANAGRHILGVDAEGKFKAISVAELLQRRFPHSNVVGHAEAAQQFVGKREAELRAFDLLISTTGDWAADSYLNEWWHPRTENRPHVLFGWLEAHALAGHAVLLTKKDSCFRCHFEKRGVFEFTQTQWPAPTQIQEPACGGLFQPYGPVDVGFITSTIASLAMRDLLEQPVESTHQFYLAPESQIRSLGGSLTESARELRGDTSTVHASILTFPWRPNPECPRCKSRNA
jgi:molybdopterin/thiamine biosynthesis adenylyltransferase